MDLEMKKVPGYIAFIDEKIPKFAKGANQANYILMAVRPYYEKGHAAVMQCLRDLEDMFKQNKLLTKDVRIIAIMIQDCRLQSTELCVIYERLSALQNNHEKALDTAVKLRETLNALHVAYSRIALLRQRLSAV